MPRFSIEYTVTGTCSALVTTSSLEEAEAIARSVVADEDWQPDLAEVEEATFRVVQFYPVMRDGKEIWTTHPRTSDHPLQDEA